MRRRAAISMMRLLGILIFLPLAALAELVPAGRLVWEQEHLSKFGGFSGIEVFADGRFLTISDRGNFFWGEIRRENGELAEVWLDNHTPILDSKGNPLSGLNTDSEGLAIGLDGVIYVSFEGNHRVMRHADKFEAAEFVPLHPDFANLQRNSGMEALAVDQSDNLYTIPERSGQLDRPFPVYRFNSNEWARFGEIARSGDFLIAGADVGPDGRFYVLERGASFLRGFHIRIRRFTIADGLQGDEILYESRAGNLSNFEGISVWRDETGQTRLTLIADDNFNAFQRTIIEEYLVVD